MRRRRGLRSRRRVAKGAGGAQLGGELRARGRGAVQVQKLNPVYPWLESAWFQPLNLIICDILVSSLCFQVQLVPLRRGGAG
jgi:hypothetical protein